MTTVDIKQQELDFLEQQVLTDIFGGFTPDKFVYRYGFFKLDLTSKVQTAISKFEGIVKPIMDDNGYIAGADLKKFVNEDFFKIPDGKFRLIDVYRKYQPFVGSLINYFMG